jgi:hypothetical protein
MRFKNVSLLCLLLTILATTIKFIQIPILIEYFNLQYLLAFITDNIINITLLIFFTFLYVKQS